MEENINILNIIKEHISKDVTKQELINVFDILLKQEMITSQEHGRAINKIIEKYNTIPNNNK